MKKSITGGGNSAKANKSIVWVWAHKEDGWEPGEQASRIPCFKYGPTQPSCWGEYFRVSMATANATPAHDMPYSRLSWSPYYSTTPGRWYEPRSVDHKGQPLTDERLKADGMLF